MISNFKYGNFDFCDSSGKYIRIINICWIKKKRSSFICLDFDKTMKGFGFHWARAPSTRY